MLKQEDKAELPLVNSVKVEQDLNNAAFESSRIC